MTELCSQLCTTPPNSSIESLRSAGPPLGDWKIHISNESEICVQGSPLFLGYWQGDHLEDQEILMDFSIRETLER